MTAIQKHIMVLKRAAKKRYGGFSQWPRKYRKTYRHLCLKAKRSAA